MKLRLALAGLLAAAWLALSGWWLSVDRLPVDGDEMGHIGAAELYRYDLEQGQPAQALQRLWSGEMGDYPPAYAASVGLWWWALGGHPSDPKVRSINLLFALGAAVCVGAIARRLGADPGAAALGAAATLWLPLNTGLSRHFMPEGMLAFAVALAILAALHQRQRGTWASAALLGLSLAFAFLVKQSAALYLAAPVLGLVRWRKELLALPVGLLLALPWVVNNLDGQGGYLLSSATHQGDAGLLAHLAFYPRALWAPALGPLQLVLAGVGIVAAFRGQRRLGVVAGIWASGILLLLLLPNKYERLMLPLLPATGLLVTAALQWAPRLAWGTPLLAAWTAWLSVLPSPMSRAPAPNSALLHGCPQVWLRPPEPSDWGLSAVVEAARRAPEGPVLVLGEGSIPCEVQTTHPWSAHLAVALRRSESEREVIGSQTAAPGLIVDWRPGQPGEPVDAGPLGRFVVRVPRGR
ncbi:MAG: phospholipid carrier-dependent glycosyltransferase [Myxococcota bacterium]|nr:phospholipid carrier-dependent glycosyltransferase [Myxococcota bacterium]